MGKIKKKGTTGQAKNYITRTQAVRKLQISLPDFRRLCIFKGIYPREPRNKKKAFKSSTPSTTFYYTRDIQFLLHEPLLQKFRDQKSLAKKIARLLGRGEVGDAARLEKNLAPKLTLDHLVKERYPTFTDALRDLDDALSLLFLFANLPSTSTVPPKTHARCQRLCHEFQHYLIATNSLRKSFLSIKGIYYQATIEGQDIMWLVPYRFVQQVTGDIDFRIMGTFVEFYSTLLGFVNFRLYTSIGLVYPPKFNTVSDDRGAELAAFTLEGQKVTDTKEEIEQSSHQNGNDTVSEKVQKIVDGVIKTIHEGNGDNNDQEEEAEAATERGDEIDKFEPVVPDADTLPQPELVENETETLFSSFTFFISREAPRAPLEFLLRAFGCKRIGWDEVLGDGAFTHNETDPRITHQIVDRPHLPESSLPPLPRNPQDGSQAAPRVRPGYKVPGRIYVQPQWVWDCVNECKLLRPDLYAPGATLPPHLSPWAKPLKGEYDPRLSLAEQEEQGEAERQAELEEGEDDSEGEEGSEDEESENKAGTKVSKHFVDESDEELVDGGMHVAGSSDEEDDGEDSEAEDGFTGLDDELELASESDEADEEETARTQHQKELEAEALGIPLADDEGSKSKTKKKQQGKLSKKFAAEKKKEEEELDRQKMMMSRKKRKLLDKMLHSNKKKAVESEKLRNKRRKIEKSS